MSMTKKQIEEIQEYALERAKLTEEPHDDEAIALRCETLLVLKDIAEGLKQARRPAHIGTPD